MKKWFDRLKNDSSSNEYAETRGTNSRPVTSDTVHSAVKEGAESMIIDDMEKKSRKGRPVKIQDKKAKKARAPWSVRKKTIVFSCIGVVAALLIVGGVFLYDFLAHPLNQFNPDDNKPSATNSQVATETGSQESEPTATPDPEDVLLSQSDMTLLQEKFINILLIGVDHSTDREEDDWISHGGKQDFHADVMIVLSINRETNKVSMISLPRDTYAKIPGVDGIYKLNASIDCGGGWPSADNNYSTAGFDKVCQSAQWMLGGSGSADDPIVIPYYFAVDMNAVKDLVDAIGGVDYDLEISFDNAGRNYTKGFQHMDGQAALDYMRVRKDEHIVGSGQASDSHRVERQKKMLIAIFKKIKSEGLLFSIPNIIDSFDGNLYYNMTTGQISALAYYALTNIEDPDNDIQMYSLKGSSVNIFNWNFIITDQNNRVKIIKDVYGIDVPKRTSYMLSAAQTLWGTMQAPQYMEVADPIIAQVGQLLEADKAKPVQPTATPSPSPTATPEISAGETSGTEVSPTPTATASPTATPPPGGYRKYLDTGAEWTLYNQILAERTALEGYASYASGEELVALETQLKKDITTLCGMFSITAPKDSKWRVNYESDKTVNEVYVDFN